MMCQLRKLEWVVARKTPYGAVFCRTTDCHHLTKHLGIACHSSFKKHLITMIEDSPQGRKETNPFTTGFLGTEREAAHLRTPPMHTRLTVHMCSYFKKKRCSHPLVATVRLTQPHTHTIWDTRRMTPRYEETRLVQSSRIRATSIERLDRLTELTKIRQTSGRMYMNKDKYRETREIGLAEVAHTQSLAY